MRPGRMTLRVTLFLAFQSLWFQGLAIGEPVIEGPFLGIGNEPCSVFMSTYEHNPASLDDHLETGDEGPHHKTSYTSVDYINWVQGYLSGYNLHENDGVNIAENASNGGMLNFLYRRCTETPDASFSTVLPKLIERLENR